MEQQNEQNFDEFSQKEIAKLIENHKTELTKKDEKIFDLEGKNSKLEEENEKLQKENLELKEEMAQIKAYMKKKKFSINHRPISAELLNELFGSLPIKNAFNLLAKMPNGLLAKNVQKMIICIRMAMKNNKWNEQDCGTSLIISEDGLIATCQNWGYNSVRAFLPIPALNLSIKKSIIAFYFEFEVVIPNRFFYERIGFCTKEFKLQGKRLGKSNTIGIRDKNIVWIDGNLCKLGNNYDEWFKKGEIVGLGLIYHPNWKMEFFATLNSELLGKIALPPKFVSLELFPVINLYYIGDSIRAKFDNEKWLFKEFQRVLE